AAVDPEIAADWNELQLLRHQLFSRLLADIPAGALASGVTPRSAVDTAWAIASPDSHDLLVRRLGYSLDEFRDWMKQTLTAAVLAPHAGTDATP
ncbi:TetR/AcrR family transcriptional regulator, partial [Streptomyces sp. SID7982]|nr:TetR/AcrR family transcriptional regulator [Streptomyces sp. SID7982]